MLERGLRAGVDKVLCSFIKRTLDALFMVRMLQENYERKKGKLYIYICFVELAKAFDRVP